MLKIIYLLIAALLLLFTVLDLFDEKDWKKQLTHILVMAPLILRILLIK